jgi:hypothetical protein
LIVTEMALAILLLVAAGLLLRSLLGLGRVDPGFAKDHIITAALDLPGRYGPSKRTSGTIPDRRAAFVSSGPRLR